MSLPRLNGSCPVDFPIKGNADSYIYHTPRSPYYIKTDAEFCFDTEISARRHGFYPAKR
jgi:hypothetical protein